MAREDRHRETLSRLATIEPLKNSVYDPMPFGCGELFALPLTAEKPIAIGSEE
jgi:hypothetical protein